MSMVELKASGFVNFVKEEGGRTTFLLGMSKKKKDGTTERGTLSCVCYDDCDGKPVKGDLVEIEGLGWPAEWEKDGKKGSKFQVTAKRVTKRDNANFGGKQPGKSPPPAAMIDLGEDLF